GHELRLEEQLGEGGVGLVGAAVVQAHLGVTGQVKVAGAPTVVGEREQPYLGVVAGSDADRPARFHVPAPAAKLRPVGVERERVLVGGPADRLVSGGPHRAALPVADVTELSPAISGRVLAPAGHVQVPPGGGPTPGAGDHNTVTAV